ncbi:hypothetical protein EXN66_Car001299 [Channa argus]|uniref:Uncharacterized protein n=1 Tax=Channa argus TaxID=215402 RepID=A0A6G1R196_CHAAH|nr:hypothetical protein EXN66_Car001299 [Channa argus]
MYLLSCTFRVTTTSRPTYLLSYIYDKNFIFRKLKPKDMLLFVGLSSHRHSAS